jgi:hypothetical protein
LPPANKGATREELGAGVREVGPARGAVLEQVELLRAGEGENQQVQVVHPHRVDSGQRAGQEISLLLVITLQNDLVPGLQQRIERLGRLLRWNHLARGERGGAARRPALSARRVSQTPA